MRGGGVLQQRALTNRIITLHWSLFWKTRTVGLPPSTAGGPQIKVEKERKPFGRKMSNRYRNKRTCGQTTKRARKWRLGAYKSVFSRNNALLFLLMFILCFLLRSKTQHWTPLIRLYVVFFRYYTFKYIKTVYLLNLTWTTHVLSRNSAIKLTKHEIDQERLNFLTVYTVLRQLSHLRK